MLQKSLTDSWSFFKSHVVAISILILPIIAPIEIFSSLYQYYLVSDDSAFTQQLMPVIIATLIYPIYAVAMVFYIAAIISGDKIEFQALWQCGMKFWWKYLVLSIFITVIVMLGLVFLIIPGVIFAARYAFAEFDLLLNQSNPLDAMKNSWDSTKEYMWVILCGYIVITLALAVPSYLISALFDESSIIFWVTNTVANMVYSVFATLYTIFAFRIYELAGGQNNQSSEPSTSQNSTF